MNCKTTSKCILHSPTNLAHTRGLWISTHPEIAKISLTGSIGTRKKAMASTVSTLKWVILELGGNYAAVVLDDVDPKVIALSVI